MPWTLTGEAGRGLDATERTLGEMNIEQTKLRFQTLADDTLTWTVRTLNATGAGAILPTFGQVVSAKVDGAQQFRGHVTGVKVGLASVTVTAAGPWWWMTRVPLVSEITDLSGATATRPQYVFPTGDLAQNVRNLIQRAIADGVPMALGTVAPMYSVPRITVSQLSCAEALAKLLSRCPDAVAWFDYSYTPPRLNVSRRNGAAAMEAISFTVGVDRIEALDLSPRLDLEVEAVQLPHMRRSTTGLPVYAVQTAGTASAGKLQVVAVSGPEVVANLPLESYDSEVVQTVPVDTGIGAAFTYDPVLKDAWAKRGGFTFAPAADYGVFPNLTGGIGVFAYGYGHRRLTNPIPEWLAKENGILSGTTRVTGVALLVPTGGIIGGGFQVPPAISYLQSIGRAWVGSANGQQQIAVLVDYEVETINQPFLAARTFYKKADYDFMFPPAGMAAGLRTAQAWIPWEGLVTLVSDSVDGQNLLGSALNISGTLPQCATMRTLLRGVTYDLMRGRMDLEVGAPARLDYGTAVGRVSTNPQDVIVTL